MAVHRQDELYKDYTSNLSLQLFVLHNAAFSNFIA